MTTEMPETKSTALKGLRELGFNSWKDRRDFLEKHREEIEAYFREHGRKKTIAHFRLGENVLRRLGLTRRRKPKQIVKPDEGAVTPERLLDMLPPDTDVGYLIAKGLFDRITNFEKELADAQAEVAELKEQLAKTKDDHAEIVRIVDEKQKRIEHYEETLSKAKLPKVTLDDLKHVMGRGSNGTRRSFVP